MADEKEQQGTEEKRGQMLDNAFEQVGRMVARSPWTFIGLSLVVCVAASSGRLVLESESRPEKQWIPDGALALDHMEYVKKAWPSQQRFNMWIAVDQGGGNVLTAAHMQRLQEINTEIMGIVIDGATTIADDSAYDKYDATKMALYNGDWSFQGAGTTEGLCFRFGPFCAQQTILSVLPTNTTLTNANVLAAVNSPPPGVGFEIPQVAAGLSGSPGSYTGADALFGFFALTKAQAQFMASDGREIDPINKEWERQALCKMGIDADPDMSKEKGEDCSPDSLLKFRAQFARSFGDEFGSAIGGDIAAVVIAYYLMAAYLFVALSRYDTVHSMMGMSCVALTICGMSVMSCMGLGGFIGIYNNSLTGNIPFLLLGLGIDDAFVLTSEFRRATQILGAGASIEDRTAEAMKGGATSILITSATDAMAFLVGASTVMPALRWFCIFAGFGIIFCFFFQITVFMPCLVLNNRRTDAGFLDCFCCIKANDPDGHDLDKPKGCAALCCTNDYSPGALSRFLSDTWGPFITSTAGMGLTAAVFLGLLVMALIGCASIEVDFQIEWFIPDDSYVSEYFDLNTQYFATGTTMMVYTHDVDYYAQQLNMINLDAYLQSTPYVDHTVVQDNWHAAFLAFCRTTTSVAALSDPSNTWGGKFTVASGLFTDEAIFYSALSAFFQAPTNSRYLSSMQWVDDSCDAPATWSGCNWAKGLAGTRMEAMISASTIDNGMERFDTMVALRDEVDAQMAGAFPYARPFANWEEVGIIGGEMVHNLIICGVVIVLVIFAMIPEPRVAGWVVFCICLSILDVVGWLYWWDVKVNSISTIYILISVGLAVDYSAHIAHMFKQASGTANERACDALGRIGPCVLNAIISTFLAVVVFSFSKSFVFRTMFKAFALVVVIAGAHGLWALPVLLSLAGGDNIGEAGAAAAAVPQQKMETENPMRKDLDDDLEDGTSADSGDGSNDSGNEGQD